MLSARAQRSRRSGRQPRRVVTGVERVNPSEHSRPVVRDFGRRLVLIAKVLSRNAGAGPESIYLARIAAQAAIRHGGPLRGISQGVLPEHSTETCGPPGIPA